MAQVTTWTWRVSSMYTVQDVPNQPDYITLITWRLAGSDGTYDTEVGNNLQFLIDDANSNFIPYANLTEDIVIGWVQESLGLEGIAEYKTKVQAIIDSMEAPANPPSQPEYTPLPWVTN